MARRSTAERGLRPAMPGGGFPAARAPDGPAALRSAGRTTWRGAGGRWWVWIGRFVIWAVLVVVAVNGVRAIFLRVQATSAGAASAPAVSASSRFPASLAEAFALQFGEVYLNFDQAQTAARARQLAAFIPAGSSQEFGWNGLGRMQLQAEQVAGITVQDAHNALVQLLVEVNGQLMELSVPVYAASGGMVIAGQPALLPPPPLINPPTQAATGNPDLTTENVFENFLPSFLQAYAASDTATLARYITKGYSITGLGGAVNYGSIQSLYVPQGGSARNITVTVRWQLPSQGGAAAATLDVTYAMRWVYQSGTWSVESISGSTQQAGQS
jgi:hypothetical protein